jgi:hypothetical protein
MGVTKERWLSRGFCGATARKPISHISMDSFREGCRNQTRCFANSFV